MSLCKCGNIKPKNTKLCFDKAMRAFCSRNYANVKTCIIVDCFSKKAWENSWFCKHHNTNSHSACTTSNVLEYIKTVKGF